MEIIVGHANPDFDACASMVAAGKIYPDARIVFLGSQNRNVREFFGLHGDMVRFLDVGQVEKEVVSRLIVVDTRVAERLGEMAPVAMRKGVEVFCYDHHPPSVDDMRCSRDFSRETGAATTLLVALIRERCIPLSVFEATLFALGIHEDTGSLTFQTTTAEDAEALAWLMNQGASPAVLGRFLSRALSGEQAALYRQLEETGRVERINGVDVLIATARVDDYVDAASVLTHRLADSMDIDVIFSLVAMRDRVHIIGRSRTLEVDAAEVLLEFGGGGHPQAASAAVRGRPLELLTAQLRDALAVHVRPPLTARDIMTRRVRSVGPTASVGKAGEVMRRYGHGGLPVIAHRRLVGLITRRDVEKAELHGLSHAPVKGFMSRQPVTIGPDATIPEMEQTLIARGVGRLPVVIDGSVVGIVTRKDVLEAQHGGNYVAVEGRPHLAVGREAMKERLTRQMPADVAALLGRLGESAARARWPVYLVGGFVRDLLLGVANLDVDLVVEGDGIAFAKAVVAELGGRVRGHSKFGTAVIVLPNGFRLDVASARSEFYEAPAALPTVEAGASIRQDLSRRDFTINAMAVGLGGDIDGCLVDFFGGVRDLETGTVRVLHNLSFVEDPTRIYRGVRFEQRYGFTMDPQTEQLARQAVEMGFHERLSGPRVREELIALLSETDAWRAFRRLMELGAARELEPAAHLGRRTEEVFAGVEEGIRRLDPYFARRPRKWLAHLATIMLDVPTHEVQAWAARMRLKRVDVAVLMLILDEEPALLSALSGPRKPSNSALYRLLAGRPNEMLLHAWASGGKRARERISFFLEHLADVRTSITGRDLLRLGMRPSRDVGEVLQEVLVARLDGRVSDRVQELAFAKRVAATRGVNLAK